MDGGGAIFVRGGRFKVVNTRFYGNRCASTGPDVGGAAIQVFSQYDGRPVYVVHSTFGGPDARRNACSNGGAISSIGVSWTILNSLFANNRADRHRRQPAQDRHARWRQRRRHLQRRQRDDAARRGHADRAATAPTARAAAPSSSSATTASGYVEIEDSVLRDNTGDGFSDPPGHLLPGPAHHVHELGRGVGRARASAARAPSSIRSQVRLRPLPLTSISPRSSKRYRSRRRS